MSKRFLEWDGDPNSVAMWWHENGNGEMAAELVQDTTGILEMNHAIREHCDVYSPDRDIRMDARIPHVVIEIWRQQYGIDFYQMSDPDQQKFIDRILDSNEWWKLRTSKGSL